MKTLHLIGPPPYETNCFVLISDEGHALVIDPALPAYRIKTVLQKQNAELSMMLLTHGHFDHVLGVKELAEEYHCPVYLDSADVKGSSFYPLEMQTIGYTEGGTVELDEIKITTIHTPGHTEGSWLLQCEDLLFTGDTLFAGSVGRTDLPGGDPAKLRASLKKIKTLDLPAEMQVLPGHGSFSTLGEERDSNPYLTM